MNKLKNYFVFLVFTIAILSCKKTSNENFTGTFVGTFTVQYTNSTSSGNTTVNFIDNGKYNCSGNTNYIPAGGSGTFTKTTSKMIFNDINYWTANFDGNLILNGEYDYSFDGKNLKLTAFKNNVGQYEYNLTKQ